MKVQYRQPRAHLAPSTAPCIRHVHTQEVHIDSDDEKNAMTALEFSLVDVFSRQALSGNGLAVFHLNRPWPMATLLRITQEMRQFESIFLRSTDDPRTVVARVFTMEEELGFAGHPILGAAAVLHSLRFTQRAHVTIQFALPRRTTSAFSRRLDAGFLVEMDQGGATFGEPIDPASTERLLMALRLDPGDSAPGLPIQVVSTGLPYLIVPIRRNIDRARIAVPNFESVLSVFGAKFVYVLDVENLEGRTWDNDGRVEDIATGSAAGPAGAFLVKHRRSPPNKPITLHQGRFVGRPSELEVVVSSPSDLRVRVSGNVILTGSGRLLLPDSYGDHCPSP